MATRSLTEIYINLRTEITRFKAYSLGDSVRSDSPGVLYLTYAAAKTYSVFSRLKEMDKIIEDDIFCLDFNRMMTLLRL